MVSYLAIVKVMTCIALSLLNLLQPVFVELLLQAFPFFKFSLLCITNIPSSLLALFFLGTERLCFLCSNNNVLDYVLLVTEPTSLTDTSILTEEPFKGKEEDVKETRGRKLSPFMIMMIHVFSGKGSIEETSKLMIALLLMLLLALLVSVFSLPISKKYLDNKFSRFCVLWLQKWVENTLALFSHKNKKENNSFLFKDPTLKWEKEHILLVMLLLALLLCLNLLYLVCLIRYKIK